MEDGAVTHPEAGSPQGGVISPVLANVYLHYVLDEWFRQEVQPRLEGPRLPGPLRRRLRDRVYRRGRRAASDGRAAEAIRQVRPDDPPGQDPAGAVPQAARRADAGPQTRRPGNVRLPGVHALLGALPEGELGSEAEDGGQPVHAGGQDDRPMVPAPSPRSDCGATQRYCARSSEGTAAYYGITGNSSAISRFHYAVLRVWRKWLIRRRRAWRGTFGLVRTSLAALSSAVCHSGSLGMPSRSERIT